MARSTDSDGGCAERLSSKRAGLSSRAPGTSVLLVDDHAVFRQGLRAMLTLERDLVVVGEAQDGLQAVGMALELQPDVVLTDISMPRLNGIEAARQILAAAPDTRVMALSAYDDDEYVARALSVGVVAYVLKGASLDELVAAIRTARRGNTYVSPLIPWHEHSRVRSIPHRTDRLRMPSPIELTSREAEVLRRIAEGAHNREIGQDLGISEKTVEKHRQSLMRKLDIHDVAGLTRYAVSSGVVELCVGH